MTFKLGGPLRTLLLVITSLSVCVIPAGVALADAPPSWGDLQPGSHGIGFRLIEDNDPSRAIRVDRTSAGVHPRPIRVYVWYPAKASADAKRMRFGRYVEMADEDVWPDTILGKARERMLFSRRPLARSLGPERFAELLKQPVGAVENAMPAEGPFPLIVVGQGLYYESPITHAILCEFLASHGFVVATAPLVGTHSPLVSLDVMDLETQVRDLELVIARARELPFVSREKLGLVGFDMGGMACLILAMRNPDVDAFASMETAILFPDLSIPTSSPHHDPALLRSPWLHAVRRNLAAPRGEETPSLFETAIHADRYLVLLDGLDHVDFTSYALIEDRNPVMGYWPPPKDGERSRYEAVCLYLSRFFAAYLADDRESRGFLARDPEETVPKTSLTIEHHPAAPPQPTDSEFLNALLAGNTDDATEMAHGIRKGPGSALLQEPALDRLGYHLLLAWELADAAIAVFKLNVELNPQSAHAHESLGRGYMLSGDEESAIRSFKKVLDLDPDDEGAKRTLERLEHQAESTE
jgi:pimeloyl-ACP methyl ester carboxylesterase